MSVVPPKPPSVPPSPPDPRPLDIQPPEIRPLKAYAFDPSAGTLLGNEMTLNVRYQELYPGPVVKERQGGEPLGAAIAVVDYDASNRTYYKAVDLDDPRILIRGGLSPSESDPRFHQQMVYAVVTETIQHFEAALGRRIHWRRAERKPEVKNAWVDDIRTLLLYPHAFIGANAFYSPFAHGILFGYFKAGKDNVGRSLPGQTVFTCLSHDVVAHETTHAIVDGIRAHFTERTNLDVTAFHEAFADLAALFRHFTHGEVLRDTLERTGGALYRYQLMPQVERSGFDDYADSADGRPMLSSQLTQRNPLIELAQQFGEATGTGRALRSALGSKPNADDIKRISEPHLRGSILVAAVFDAYFSIYQKVTADLWRIYRAGGGRDNPTDLPQALANRLCHEATHLAEQFFQICVRALDYCAPVDITFGDYLRAIITADFDLWPRDPLGMRDALMQSFRLRGIYPDGAGFFSENAIAWPKADMLELPPVVDLDFGDPNGLTKPQKDHVRKVLQAYIDDPDNRARLGFAPGEHVEIPSFHPLFRTNPDGSLRTDMVVEMVQTRQAYFDPKTPGLGTFPLRGGATLLIQKPIVGEPEALRNQANIRYAITKRLDGAEGVRRMARQIGFAASAGLVEGSGDERFRINFAMLHEGL